MRFWRQLIQFVFQLDLLVFGDQWRCICASHPLAQIDIGAPQGAEWTVFFVGVFLANRAGHSSAII